MGSNIASVTYAEGAKKTYQLTNADWVRTLNIGNNWNVIRLGALVAIQDTGANIVNSHFILGVQNGNTENFGGGGDMSNFLGVSLGRRATDENTYNYNADVTYGNFYHPAFGVGLWQKVGATLTVTQITTNSRSIASTSDTVARRKTPIIVQIEKGSPNYTFRSWGFNFFNNASFNINYTYDHLDATMATAGTSLLCNGNGLTLNSAAIAADEVGGNLDSICMYWQHPSSYIEVAYLAVKKIS